jgi:F-box-like
MEVTGISVVAHGGCKRLTLLQILSNPLILYHTVPHLPISSLLALGAACRDLRDLVHHTPQVFRYLDLSHVKSLQFEISRIDNGGEVWRNVQLDENVTEDE